MKSKIKDEPIAGYEYNRYSCHQQDSGNSIHAQQNAIREFAKENNIQIVGTYIDKAKTGTNTNRDGYQKMLSDLEKNPDVKCIIVHVLDRLHRNVREQLNMIYELKGRGIRILTTTGIDTMDEECMSEILDEACQAEKYSRRLSKETRKGLKINAEQAVHNGGYVPYGFKLGADKHLEIDEIKAPAVRKIFEMYATGLSYKQIIKWLDENDYKTVNNRSFVSSTIKSMLENEKYCGIYYWDKSSAKDYRGKHNSHRKKDNYIQIKDGCPAIVSEEIFNKVQERLRDNKNKIRNHNGKNFYPMNGKIHCEKCGTKLSGKVQYSRTNKDNKPTKQYKTNCDCHNVKTINEMYLDDMIMYALRECIFSPVNTDELLERLNQYAETQNKDNQLQADILKAQKEELIQSQNNLISVIEKGTDTEAVRNRLHDIESQIKAVDDKISSLLSASKTFTIEDLTLIKEAFVNYVREECNEDTIAVLSDTINDVKVGDTITVSFNDGIRVSRDTKKIFN